MRRSNLARRCAAVLAATALIASCGGDDDDARADTLADTSAETPTTEAESSATDAPEATTAPEGTSGAPTTASEPAGPANTDPIKIGLLGFFTGIGAPVHLPKQAAYEAWVESVNANGGINGHPVELIVMDHGGDQAQAVTMARQLVESDGVVAFATTGSVEGGAVAYAQEAGVPVIGVGAGPFDQAANPFMFGTGPGALESAANVAAQVKAAGFTKVAALYCSEAPGCKQGSDATVAALKAAGIEVVQESAISLTAPDYTAECLQAKNAGADLIFPTGTNETPAKIADSCTRQDYTVPFLLGSASNAQEGNELLDGSISVQSAFPFFLRDGSPALEEYAAAIAGTKIENEGTSDQAAAWVAAKVFQHAAEIGITASDAPSSELVLEGLYTMQGYDVEGLMPGCMSRTYTEGQPPAPTTGSFLIMLEGGKWTAPKGVEPLCL